MGWGIRLPAPFAKDLTLCSLFVVKRHCHGNKTIFACVKNPVLRNYLHKYKRLFHTFEKTDMKNKNILIALVAILTFSVLGCGKDKFTTKPQLEFLRAEDYEVPRGGLIKFYLEVTDAEGDLSDSLFIASTVAACPNSNRSLGFPMPNFPHTANVKAQIEVTFANGVFIPGYPALPSPACGRPDTTVFHFWVKDQAGNVSDTIQTDKPLIIQN